MIKLNIGAVQTPAEEPKPAGIHLNIPRPIITFDPAMRDYSNDMVVFIHKQNATVSHSSQTFHATWRTCDRDGDNVPLWPVEEYFAREKTTKGARKGIRRRHPYGKPEGDSAYIKDRIYIRCQMNPVFIAAARMGIWNLGKTGL